ncbi:amino-acid N-acetyltransferase [Thalassotalea sp. G20_0]|uniref:amino-acid N-acetyltransferase n=1 Tax=Thalassotalea sp. G20_0 TaxID=2821093 RepID=UPI00336A398D
MACVKKKEHSADNVEKYVKFFRQSSPYIHAHRGKTFVIMLSGETLAHPNLGNIISDIALMSSLGVRLVLVHGARPQIDERLRERGIKTVIHQGGAGNGRLHNERRVTDRQSLECVKDAAGNMRALIESRLSMGLVNSPMHGARIRVVSGNFVTAKPLGVLDGIDFKHTGEVRKIDSQAIDHLLDSGYVVLLSCLGLSPTGEIFNIEAEEVATRTAISLQAEKLILYAEQQGIFDHQGNLINRISPHEAIKELESQTGESRRLLSSAVTACSDGVERAQIISYQDDGSLLMELFTRDGAGTLISRDHYEEVRGATIEDVGGILELIRPFEEKGILRRRSRKELEREIKLFSVVLLDGMIIGCAALHPYHENGTSAAELACVVVHPEYRDAQRGDRLLAHIEALAEEQGMNEIYVMTTQTTHWFIEREFAEVACDDLPAELKAKYNPKRQSKVLMKTIG